MIRRTKPGERNWIHQKKNNSTIYGENGAPGYMRAPGRRRCPERKDHFPHLGDCVNLSICAYYCKKQCQKYLRFKKEMKRKTRRVI